MRFLPNFLDILNSQARSRGSRHIDWEALTSAFPSLRDEARPTGTARLTMSVHCECSIASHILRKLLESDFPLEMIRPKHIEIGISEYSCWMYEKYMDLGNVLHKPVPPPDLLFLGFRGEFTPAGSRHACQ